MSVRPWLFALAPLMLAGAACGDDSGEPTTTEPAATDTADGEAALPDPCAFATPGEVGDVLGVDMESGISGSGDFDGILTETCGYRATGGEPLFASVQVLSFEDPDEVRKAFARFGDAEDADIDGLPDSTFVTDVDGFRTIFVLDAAQPYGVNVTDGEEDLPREAERLALALYEPA